MGFCQDSRTDWAVENNGVYAHSVQRVLDYRRLLPVCMDGNYLLAITFLAFPDGCAGKRILHYGGGGT